MFANGVITTLLLVNLLPLILASYCDLKLWNKEWLNEWRLLLTNNGDQKYQFLREWNVQDGINLCMVSNSDPSVVTAKCQNRNFNINLPLVSKCDETNSIQPSKIEQKVSYCPYSLYKIGFNVKIGGSTQFLETYQVCFDKEHMRPVFTINKAYPIADGRPDFLQFNPDDIFYGNLFHAFDRSSTFRRFNNLLGNAQNYMSSSNLDHIIDRGHLTPSADFITTNLKKSTFSMINVIPQFRTINNGNWRFIEEWARDKSRTPANICNGVFDCNLNSNKLSDLNCILQLKNAKQEMVPMFLADSRQIPIPLWSFKIVRSKDNHRSVFLTYNNIYHEGDIQPPVDVCDVEECPLKLAETIQDGRTFCCKSEKFINKAVPNLKEIC